MRGLIPFSRNVSNPVSIFGDFQGMLDNFFEDNWIQGNFMKNSFKLDVQDVDNKYLVQAELPGINKEDINISLEDNSLTISVNKQEIKEEEKKNYIHKERRISSMSRSIYLDGAVLDNIKAKLEGGILNIEIEKREKENKSCNINIE